MRAAIYARKSNEDDRSEDNKSVTRQVERAKAFAGEREWTVDDQHVFVDDGISGAEYKDRPGLLRMLSALKDIDVIVTSEISRLGRDMVRNAVLIDDVRNAGARIFYYLTGEEELADTPEQRLMITLKSYAAEVERAKTGQRTRDTLERKAAKGYSAGGSCYGYDLVPIIDPVTGERLHTDFAVNEAQAEVVRAIFTMYADGYGQGTIAKALNGDARFEAERRQYFGGMTHAAPRNGLGCWGPSGIRAMLYRTRYIGPIQYGLTKKVRGGGSAKKRTRGANPVTVERPDVRIVSDELWERTQKRLNATRQTYLRENGGLLWGRPDRGNGSKYLLSGLARCGCCGGNITIASGNARCYYYGCSVYTNKGHTVCTNDHRGRMKEVNAAVLGAIESTVLTPAAFDYVVDKACGIIEAALQVKPEHHGALVAEARKLPARTGAVPRPGSEWQRTGQRAGRDPSPRVTAQGDCRRVGPVRCPVARRAATSPSAQTGRRAIGKVSGADLW
jgi:site-specific DNA recombinase